jgi:hypothetical protein
MEATETGIVLPNGISAREHLEAEQPDRVMVFNDTDLPDDTV